MTQTNEFLPRPTTADPHLDGLLERALQGTASEAELASLGRHAAACTACAALLALGPTLARRVAQVPADETRDRRAVALALSASRGALPAGRAKLVWGIAVAGALVGSVAAAQYLGVIPRFSTNQQPDRLAEARPITLPLPAVKQRVPSTEPKASALEGQPSSVDTEAPRTQPAPAAGAAEPEAQTAAGLFAAANHLRRTGQDAQAIQTFYQLQRAFPRSGEAAVSHATLGSFLLQRGDAKAALGQFDRYVAHGGPVLEEALAGRARALARLGDGVAERSAWQALLGRFPSSVHAARARARLDELR